MFTQPFIRAQIKVTSNICVTGLCVGNSPVNSPHKWSVTRQMFPFDDVIMDECDRLMCNRQNKAWKPLIILCFTAFYYTVINAEHAIYIISDSDELINMVMRSWSVVTISFPISCYWKGQHRVQSVLLLPGLCLVQSWARYTASRGATRRQTVAKTTITIHKISI